MRNVIHLYLVSCYVVMKKHHYECLNYYLYLKNNVRCEGFLQLSFSLSLQHPGAVLWRVRHTSFSGLWDLFSLTFALILLISYHALCTLIICIKITRKITIFAATIHNWSLQNMEISTSGFFKNNVPYTI